MNILFLPFYCFCLKYHPTRNYLKYLDRWAGLSNISRAGLLFHLYISLVHCIYWGLHVIISKWYEPQHEISNNVVCATSKVSDQPAPTRSLIWAFASRLIILWVLSYWLNIVWSFYETAQARLSLFMSTFLKISCHSSNNIRYLSLKIDFVMANSADPDEMAHFHLGLNSLFAKAPVYCLLVWFDSLSPINNLSVI